MIDNAHRAYLPNTALLNIVLYSTTAMWIIMHLFINESVKAQRG